MYYQNETIMKTTTLNNGLKVLTNTTSIEHKMLKNNLMRDYGTKSYIWKDPFGGRCYQLKKKGFLKNNKKQPGLSTN